MKEWVSESPNGPANLPRSHLRTPIPPPPGGPVRGGGDGRRRDRGDPGNLGIRGQANTETDRPMHTVIEKQRDNCSCHQGCCLNYGTSPPPSQVTQLKKNHIWLRVGYTTEVPFSLFLGPFSTQGGQRLQLGQEWSFVAGVSHFQGQLSCAFKVIPRRGLGRH